jgi:hypothetical protein
LLQRKKLRSFKSVVYLTKADSLGLGIGASEHHILVLWLQEDFAVQRVVPAHNGI